MHRSLARSGLALASICLAGTSLATTQPVIVQGPDGLLEITIHAGDGRSPDALASVLVSADPSRVEREGASFAARAAKGPAVSAAEALTAARKSGLAPGVEPWRASLAFDESFGAPTWRIANTLERRSGHADGRSIVVHAESGAVLANSAWSMDLEGRTVVSER